MSEVTMYRVVADVLARVGNYLTTRIASGEDRSHRCRLKSLGAVMWLIRGYPRSPHGEVRPFHRKSTCLTQSTLGPYVVQVWSRDQRYRVVADVLAGVGDYLTTRIASRENTSHSCRLEPEVIHVGLKRSCVANVGVSEQMCLRAWATT